MASERPCPYCMADIPVAARKCRHCGEWVTASDGAPPPPAGGTTSDPGGIVGRFFTSRRLDQTLNEGVKIWAGYQIVMMVVGLIGFLVVAGAMCNAASDGPDFSPRSSFHIEPGQ